MPKGIVIDARNRVVEERQFDDDDLLEVATHLLGGRPDPVAVAGSASWFILVNPEARAEARTHGFVLHTSAPIWGDAIVFGVPSHRGGGPTDAPMSADELEPFVHFQQPFNVFISEPFDTSDL